MRKTMQYKKYLMPLTSLTFITDCLCISIKKNECREIFLNNGERPCTVGTILKQPLLAETLQHIAKRGVEEFYTGEIADCIVKDMENNNGLIQKDDLAQIPYPIERETVSCRFENIYVHTIPPPGAGKMLIELTSFEDAL